MSDPVLLAIVASIPPTLAALAGVLVSLRNTSKLTEIHTLTNSNLTKVMTDLVIANARVGKLEELVAAMVQQKKDMADSDPTSAVAAKHSGTA